MRLTNVFGGRPAFYDRNPTTKAFAYNNGGTAPAGYTIRNTYTVPSGRKFFLAAWAIFFNRLTVATTIGQTTVRMEVTPSGGSLTLISYMETEGSNVVDANRQMNGGGSYFGAGDVLDEATLDNSTAGTVDFNLQMHGTEFDA